MSREPAPAHWREYERPRCLRSQCMVRTLRTFGLSGTEADVTHDDERYGGPDRFLGFVGVLEVDLGDVVVELIGAAAGQQ